MVVHHNKRSLRMFHGESCVPQGSLCAQSCSTSFHDAQLLHTSSYTIPYICVSSCMATLLATLGTHRSNHCASREQSLAAQSQRSRAWSSDNATQKRVMQRSEGNKNNDYPLCFLLSFSCLLRSASRSSCSISASSLLSSSRAILALHQRKAR